MPAAGDRCRSTTPTDRTIKMPSDRISLTGATSTLAPSSQLLITLLLGNPHSLSLHPRPGPVPPHPATRLPTPDRLATPEAAPSVDDTHPPSAMTTLPPSLRPTAVASLTPPPVLVPPINFALVAPGVYRSGHPNRRNFGFLQRLGLKTVL